MKKNLLLTITALFLGSIPSVSFAESTCTTVYTYTYCTITNTKTGTATTCKFQGGVMLGCTTRKVKT